MSALKTSQIHDGFATIRSRGLQRSRSRVEQLERLKPITMKCDSMPLYENPSALKNNINNNNNNSNNHNNNNNNSSMNKNVIPTVSTNDHQIVYKFESFSGSTEMPTINKTLSSEAKLIRSVNDLKITPDKSNSCATFKVASSNSQLSTSDQSGNIDANDRSSLPPPSPCYESYTNGFHSPKTPPDSIRSSTLADYFLYARPTSPIYETYTTTGSHASSSSDGINPSQDIMYSSSPPSSKLFTASYYSKSDAIGEYALQKILKKPSLNYKAQSLQYRKSYSHPTRPIHETSTMLNSTTKFDRGIRNYYNSTTNYYDPSEISYIGSHTMHHKPATHSSERLSANNSERSIPIKLHKSHSTRSNHAFHRPYATLAHPRDVQHRLQNRQMHNEQQRKYASNEFTTTQNDFEYLDPLDCKIGCQTTLRSKPQIPWYELAIKRDHRRQSCPTIQVN